jgi:hypothetical protein
MLGALIILLFSKESFRIYKHSWWHNNYISPVLYPDMKDVLDETLEGNKRIRIYLFQGETFHKLSACLARLQIRQVNKLIECLSVKVWVVIIIILRVFNFIVYIWKLSLYLI